MTTNPPRRTPVIVVPPDRPEFDLATTIPGPTRFFQEVETADTDTFSGTKHRRRRLTTWGSDGHSNTIFVWESIYTSGEHNIGLEATTGSTAHSSSQFFTCTGGWDEAIDLYTTIARALLGDTWTSGL